MQFRLKAKGLKHGGKPKAKKVQMVSNEELATLVVLANKLTPVWRITQGIKEVGAKSMKDTGNLLKWVNLDILKEEVPSLVEAGIEFKQVQSYVSKVVKDYFVDYLKDC
jgi:hypothetical protein